MSSIVGLASVEKRLNNRFKKGVRIIIRNMGSGSVQHSLPGLPGRLYLQGVVTFSISEVSYFAFHYSELYV